MDQPLLEVTLDPVKLDHPLEVTLDAIELDDPPDHLEAIPDKYISSFHMYTGLVPSGCSVDEFEQVRSLYLAKAGHSHFVESFPSFVVVTESSTCADIHKLFLWAGVPAATVKKMTDVDYEMFDRGLLGPDFTSSHLELVRTRFRQVSRGFIRHIESSTLDHLDSLFQRLMVTSRTITDTLARYPVTILNNPKWLKVAPDTNKERSSMVPMTQLPSEFKSEFQNYDYTIARGLVPDIIDRFTCQNTFSGEDKDRENIKSRAVFAPIAHLVNASGTGKTRSAIELGELTNVLFWKFGNDNGLLKTMVGEALTSYLEKEDRKTPTHRLSWALTLHAIMQRIIWMGRVVDEVKNMDGCLLADAVVKDYIELLLEVKDEFKDLAKFPDFRDRVKAVLLSGLDTPIQADPRIIELFDTDSLLGYLPVDDISLTWQYALDFDSNNELSIDPSISLSEMTKANQEWLKSRAQRLRAATTGVKDKKVLAKLPDLIFVFDEVHDLMLKYRATASVKVCQGFGGEEVVDTYRVLRSMFRYIEGYWDYLLLTISTVAKMSHFAFPKDDPSLRADSSFKLHHPIILRHTMDAFCSGIYVKDCESDWLKFVKSRRRLRHIIHCGRPLLSVLLNPSDLEADELTAPGISNYQGIIVKTKLLVIFKKLGSNMMLEPNLEIFKFGKIQTNEAAALLGLAAALYKFPHHLDRAEMVRSGPMILIDFKPDVKDPTNMVAVAMSTSEGTLNGCAAVTLTSHFEDLIKWLVDWANEGSVCLLSTGEIGELIDRMCVLVAMRYAGTIQRDKASIVSSKPQRDISQFIFEPVPLEMFLEGVAGEVAVKDYMKASPGLKGSHVAFSHFLYAAYADLETSLYDIVANALARGAAVVPKKNAKGVDMLLPLVLANGQLSFVYWQTKFGASFGHPSDTIVYNSSPNARYANVLVKDRPYAYIFRTINPVEQRCKLFPQRHPINEQKNENSKTAADQEIYTIEVYDYDAPQKGEADDKKVDKSKFCHNACLSVLGIDGRMCGKLPDHIKTLCGLKLPRSALLCDSIRRSFCEPDPVNDLSTECEIKLQKPILDSTSTIERQQEAPPIQKQQAARPTKGPAKRKYTKETGPSGNIGSSSKKQLAGNDKDKEKGEQTQA